VCVFLLPFQHTNKSILTSGSTNECVVFVEKQTPTNNFKQDKEKMQIVKTKKNFENFSGVLLGQKSKKNHH